jgi:hypothetical protein
MVMKRQQSNCPRRMRCLSVHVEEGGIIPGRHKISHVTCSSVGGTANRSMSWCGKPRSRT